MPGSLTPPRAEPCPSTWQLDRLLLGDLEGPDEVSLRAHLQRCPPCADRLHEMERFCTLYRRNPPPLAGLTTAVERDRRRPRWLGSVAGAVAVAAAIALIVHPNERKPVPATRLPPPATRIKGGASRLGFYVHHDGVVRQGWPGEVVQPGDALRFVVTTVEPRHVAIFSLDGAGQVSIYFPSAPFAAPVEPGTAVALPTSTLLDGTLGRETLIGLFCADPVPLEPLRIALSSGAAGLAVPAGCEIEQISISKETGR